MSEKNKKVIRKKREIKKYIVVFQDETGNVIKTMFVNRGEAAEPPDIPQQLGETQHYKITFSGWDQSFDCVTSNLVVKAIYSEVPKKYLIMYFNDNGKILGTETVSYGETAKAEYYPKKAETEEYEYVFKGWNCNLENISGDCMAKAVFEEKRKQFPVRFYDEEHNLVKEETVPYGEKATPPEMKKTEDAMYQYEFEGWSDSFEKVTHPIEIHARFRNIFKEYTICFYEEDKLIKKEIHHYNDSVLYPEVYKKGYEPIWNELIKKVEDNKELSFYWRFSNKKGKIVQTKKGLFEITDSSIRNGSVRCLIWNEDNVHIKLPNQIKIGEYYYYIRSIGKRAFVNCKKLKKLTVNQQCNHLEEESLAGCSKLEIIYFGKNLKKIDQRVFAGDLCLKEIRFTNHNIPTIKHNSFDKMNHRVKVSIPANMKFAYKKIFMRGIREEKIYLVAEDSHLCRW